MIPLYTMSTDWMKKPYVKGMFANPLTCSRLEVRLHRTRPVQVGRSGPRSGRAGRSLILAFRHISMLRFIVRRLLVTVPMVLVVVSLTWGLIRLAPGNFYTGEKAIPAAIDQEHSGEVRPRQAVVRAVRQDARQHRARRLRHVAEVHGAVGQLHPVAQHCPCRPRSALLAYLLALVVGIVSGTLAALRQNSRLDYASMAGAMVGISVPNFVLGPIARPALLAHVVSGCRPRGGTASAGIWCCRCSRCRRSTWRTSRG